MPTFLSLCSGEAGWSTSTILVRPPIASRARYTPRKRCAGANRLSAQDTVLRDPFGWGLR